MNSLRSILRLLAAGVALCGAVALAAPPPAAAATDPASLYARLGGYDALAAVTDDFIGRLASNPKLSKFFTGLNDQSKARVRQHVVDLLCFATGGPCMYLGQDMKTAHKGLGITSSDWDAAVVDLTATFDKFKVPARERGEVVAKLATLKADIINQ